jgi:aminopeptidase
VPFDSSRPPGVRPRSSVRPPPAIDFDLAAAARRIVEGSLGVVPGETLAILVDAPREPLATALAATAVAASASAEILKIEQFGARPLRAIPALVREALSRAHASVLMVGFADGEYAMRGEFIALANASGLRHAHMVGVGKRAMLAGFSVDPLRVQSATHAVRARLRPDSVLRMRSNAGSDVEITLDGRCRWQERVGIVRSGRWENLPSGELFTCPTDVNGVFVADASMGGQLGQGAGLLASKPVRFEIKSGICRAVSCRDRTLEREVTAAIQAAQNGNRVGMVMLGTNIGIIAPTGEILCDQNLPGLHIGFGATFADQTGATWNATTQLSVTGAAANVDLDGAPLLRSGRYLIG